MNEEVGVEPRPGEYPASAGGSVLDLAAAVVPPQQRIAMPVQRLEPVSLGRLFGESGSLMPARIPYRAPTGERR